MKFGQHAFWDNESIQRLQLLASRRVNLYGLVGGVVRLVGEGRILRERPLSSCQRTIAPRVARIIELVRGLPSESNWIPCNPQ